MKWNVRSFAVLSSIMVFSCIAHSYEFMNVSSPLNEKYLLQENEDKREMNEAIKKYLEKNPPEIISKLMYSTLEKAQPASIPEAERKAALNRIKRNITPEILTKMISAGLRRNFTADEIDVLSQYDESQLSDDLKKKNDCFKFEVAIEIRLLLAATSG